jgi:Tfp pilus assembly protein PilV
MNHESRKKGQALIEILIGLFVAGILISAATAAVVMALRSNLETKNFQTASALSQKLIDDVKTVAESDWHNIYNFTKGPDTQYYVAASGTALVILPGTATTTVSNITYAQFFSIENVNRDGAGNIVTSGGAEDPSTQKIISRVRWPSAGQTPEVTLTVYLTRWRNLISRQTDWSGGSGQEGPISEFNQKFASSSGIDYSSGAGSIIIQGF